jgi:hypothetical protein
VLHPAYGARSSSADREKVARMHAAYMFFLLSFIKHGGGVQTGTP